MANIPSLKRRWRSFWEQSVFPKRAPPAAIDAVWEGLLTRYNEPHRAYHNLDHIESCLGMLDAARTEVARDGTDAIELALWFHDAVYNTHRSDNERQSALLAKTKLEFLNVEGPFRSQVIELVLATQHSRPLRNSSAQFIADIDLSSLGQDWETFKAHGSAIKQEYNWVPEWDYKQRTRRMFERFLARESIYYLPYFKRRYESQARINLERAIAETY